MAALLCIPALSGCADLLGGLTRPDYHVRATALRLPPEWNRDGEFHVVVEEPVEVRITLASPDGRRIEESALSDLTVMIPDGVWDLSYKVGGHTWNRYDGILVDATPPAITGLQEVGDAQDGAYALGEGARVEGATGLLVVDLQSGAVVATALPVRLTGLQDGLRAYLVSARDAAGNFANATVQVRVGSAADLPPGRFTFGVVARYNNGLQLWDLRDMGAYASREQARQAAPDHLGEGFGITPGDAAVRAVVGDVVTEGMNTMQAAHALFRWVVDGLEYDESRLESDSLLTPRQVLLDREDPSGRDDGKDGLVDDGAGNGVKGGICRDLAATYVSLLRAAGVPARVVSGYVGGDVNGFHAWVEFYAGAVGGQEPWVPVDVSPIDGPFGDAILMQAFAARLPDYLPLRPVPPEAEVEGWSTAISLRYRWPPDKPAPDIQFRKEVSDDGSLRGVLCFNPTTRARQAASGENDCPGSFGLYLPDFLLRTQRTIDYGIEVVSAARGTEVTAEVAYPFPELLGPDEASYLFYGPVGRLDTLAGKAVATFSP